MVDYSNHMASKNRVEYDVQQDHDRLEQCTSFRLRMAGVTPEIPGASPFSNAYPGLLRHPPGLFDPRPRIPSADMLLRPGGAAAAAAAAQAAGAYLPPELLQVK